MKRLFMILIAGSALTLGVSGAVLAQSASEITTIVLGPDVPRVADNDQVISNPEGLINRFISPASVRDLFGHITPAEGTLTSIAVEGIIGHNTPGEGLTPAIGQAFLSTSFVPNFQLDPTLDIENSISPGDLRVPTSAQVRDYVDASFTGIELATDQQFAETSTVVAATPAQTQAYVEPNIRRLATAEEVGPAFVETATGVAISPSQVTDLIPAELGTPQSTAAIEWTTHLSGTATPGGGALIAQGDTSPAIPDLFTAPFLEITFSSSSQQSRYTLTHSPLGRSPGFAYATRINNGEFFFTVARLRYEFNLTTAGRPDLGGTIEILPPASGGTHAGGIIRIRTGHLRFTDG